MPNISILNQEIKTLNGLFSLNDLHRASGESESYRPSNFVRTEQTKALISEIEKESSESSDMSFQEIAIKSVKGGKNAGTYGCTEIIYAYAMWISSAFYLKVIRHFHNSQQPQAHKLENPYISDEQLNHIKKGVGKMVHATGKHWQAVYRDLFDYVQAPSVREIRKERFTSACEFLGIPASVGKAKADTPKLEQKTDRSAGLALMIKASHAKDQQDKKLEETRQLLNKAGLTFAEALQLNGTVRDGISEAKMHLGFSNEELDKALEIARTF